MSEQINRVLADRPQNFTTSEQARARSNIGAAASADLSAYVSTASIETSTAGITGISGTAIATGPTYSAGNYIQISGDEISVTGLQPSGDYLTSVSRSNNLAGNGTSGSPLDLSTSIDIRSGSYLLTHVEPGYVQMQDRVGGVNYTSWQRPNILAMSATGDSGSKTSVNIYTASAEIASTATDGTVKQVSMAPDGYVINYTGSAGTAEQAHVQIGTAYSHAVKGIQGDNATGHTGWNLLVGDGYFYQHPALRLDEGTAREYVDITSIRKWNGALDASAIETSTAGITGIGGTGIATVLWNESGNSLSIGYGGNQVSAASQYNAGAGNWSVRTVKMSGLPDQNLYGFQARPATAGNYLVNDAGAFISYQQPYYCKFVRNMSAGETADLGTSLYPTGVTWPCRLDIVNLSEGTAYVMTDTFHGNTASLNPGETMTTYYVPAEQYWRDPKTV